MEPRLPIVTIYTRPGCHLCEIAKANILSAGCGDDFVLNEVNIDLDPTAFDHFHNDIPVVLINGVRAFKHQIDPAEFKRKLSRLGRWAPRKRAESNAGLFGSNLLFIKDMIKRWKS